MAAVQTQIHVAPFDAVAERYDETFTRSKVGRAQRASVWKEIERVFRRGDHVLEIGCGTAVDAAFMADREVKVVACDSSPQMIAVATRRIAKGDNVNLVSLRLISAEDISILQGEGSFDGAFSNFGALNCVADSKRFARDLAVLLKPGARALLCWIGPCCLWEIAWYLAKAKPAKAFRRFHREGVTAQLAAGANVQVLYPSVKSLARIFAPEFRLVSIKGIGVSVPPSYLENWATRFPRMFELSMRADLLLADCPGIRTLADHVLLEFQREDLLI